MNKSGAPRAANTNPSSMRAPILVALPSTREREVLSVARGQQVFVDGVTGVFRVHPEYGEWEQSSRSLERVDRHEE
jgi:phosphoenolpyruvate-protein kinase (PTS system EI component)